MSDSHLVYGRSTAVETHRLALTDVPPIVPANQTGKATSQPQTREPIDQPHDGLVMIRRECPSCHRARRTSDTYPTLISNKEARWLNGKPFLVSAASGSDAGIQHARPSRTAFRCGPSSLSRHAGQLFHVEPAEGFCEAASTLPFRRWLASNAQRRNFDTTEISHMRNRHLHWARARAVYGRDRPRPASALSPGRGT